MGKKIVYGIDDTGKSREITEFLRGESYSQGIQRAQDLEGSKYKEFYVEYRHLIYKSKQVTESYKDWLIKNDIVPPEENIKDVCYKMAHENLYIQLEDDRWFWYDEKEGVFNYTRNGPI
jgi:hypothetical protein